jgi:hypothetical protein
VVLRHPWARSAYLLFLVLLVAAPAAVDAAGGAPSVTNAAASTPLDRYLLGNPGFERVAVDGSIPMWTVVGDVHVETFGTRSWPSPVYAQKYHGGQRYLACGTGPGLVRQTVAFNGWSPRLKVRLAADFGGTIGHRIRVTILITGARGETRSQERVRVLDVTDHYKRAVTSVVVPPWATDIEATVQLMPKAGAATCRTVADTVRLWVFHF